MKDLTTTASDLFNKIRSRFSDIKIGDEAGMVTSDPSQARFFDVTYSLNREDLGQVNIKIDSRSLTVIYTEGMLDDHTDDVRQDWFKFLRELRQFARRNMLTFDTRDITKSNLDKRDYAYLAQKSGENNMSESKLFGTSKTSYQDIGEAKIIVKHSQPVNYNIPAGRTQHIESIYIESASGERFRYPHRHLNGARAMATHVANGGNPYDAIGGYITGLSEEMAKLRQFKNYTQRAGVMAEALGDLPSKVAERLESVKEEVARLQKQSYYEQFREGFAPSEAQEVPEEMINQWVDALTIKTFNEELKSVFPYIYKLVAEKSELSYEDLVAEASDVCEVCHEDPCVCDEEDDVKEHSMFDEFVNKVEELASPEFESAMGEVDQIMQDIAAGRADAYDVMTNPKSPTEQAAARMLQDMYDNVSIDHRLHPDDDFEQILDIVVDQLADEYGTEEAAEPVQQQAQPVITREVLEFIQSMYDAQTGTFPRGEEGVKIACEKKFGEQAGKFAHYVVEKLSAAQPAEDCGCDTVQEDPANQTPPAIATDLGEIERIRQLAGTAGI